MNRKSGAIVYAITNHRPAVVFARFFNIEFIATLGAMLVSPHIPCYGVDIDALGVTVPVAVDFWQSVTAANERVVARHAAIVV